MIKVLRKEPKVKFVFFSIAPCKSKSLSSSTEIDKGMVKIISGNRDILVHHVQ